LTICTATPWHLRQAARCLRGGGIIAYPTEGVFGLGCDPFDVDAVLRILDLKGRGIEHGVILIGAELSHIEPFIGAVDRAALGRAVATWPGPHTWLLPAAPTVPGWIRGAHRTVALRITAHPVAAALCKQAGGALVSTSANRHGHPPARSALEVRLKFGDAVDFVLGGSTGPSRRPTEIRDAVTGKVVRRG
jgi:L-threonylcarbamoyladenylate synthase